jgi:signal transduction histidine kinase
MKDEVRRTRWALILIGVSGFLLGLAGTTLLARRMTRPLKKLVEGTVRISRGEFAHRIEPGSGDEIGDLAHSFNDMAEKLLAARRETEEAQKRLVQSEKLAQIGRLAASIAHEIRNPLTSVKLNIQKVLEDGGFSETEREHLTLSREGIAQIEKFIKEMLNFTRATELQKAPFAVEQVVDESLKMMGDAFREKKIVVEKRLDKTLPEVLLDGDRLRQVFLNLFRNAVEAVGYGGRIILAAEAKEDKRGRRIRIRVSDDGPGIQEKDWENIFEPFFTTKSWGIGLGLANARKLIELHRGTIRVIRTNGPGTTFEINLPIAREL